MAKVEKGNRLATLGRPLKSGQHRVRIVTVTLRYNRRHKMGHRVACHYGGRKLQVILRSDEKLQKPRAQYYSELVSNIGTVEIAAPGIGSGDAKMWAFN